MNIVFFGYDHSLDIAIRLIEDGHTISHIFTFPCDNIFAFNQQTINLAQTYNIPCTDQKITATDIETLIADHKPDLFLCCGYPYKIPPIKNPAVIGLNLHPALLPRARGIMPLPYIIYYEPESCGLSLHKLSKNFDCGDILAQLPLTITQEDTVDTVTAKLGLLSPDFISNALKNLDKLISNTTPQEEDKASHYPPPSTEFRTLNWHDTPDNIARKLRAFGRFGVFTPITNNIGQTQILITYQGFVWKSRHSYTAGKLIRSSPREIVVATKEGFTILTEFIIHK